MKNVFIVGGSGKTARRLAQQLSARGHTPLSLHRHAEQAEELKALGSTPVHGDLLELNVRPEYVPDWGGFPQANSPRTMGCTITRSRSSK